MPGSSPGMTKMRGRAACAATRRLNRFLQFLGGAEGDLLGGLDVDRFAGGGVAAHARGALANLEDAEPDDADALAFLQVLGDTVDHVGEDGLGLLLGEFLLLGNGCPDV